MSYITKTQHLSGLFVIGISFAVVSCDKSNNQPAVTIQQEPAPATQAHGTINEGLENICIHLNSVYEKRLYKDSDASEIERLKSFAASNQSQIQVIVSALSAEGFTKESELNKAINDFFSLNDRRKLYYKSDVNSDMIETYERDMLNDIGTIRQLEN